MFRWILKTILKIWMISFTIWIACSIICIVIGLIYSVFSLIFVIQSEKSQGTLIEFDSKYAPVVEFRDSLGNLHQFTSKLTSFPPVGRVGDEINILYNPSKPNKAKINSFLEIWFFAIVFGGLGIIQFFVFWGLSTLTKRSIRYLNNNENFNRVIKPYY